VFFKNHFKELIIALDLTKQLEDALIQDGAQGHSLSDKIKWYQEYDEDGFINAFGENGDDINELSYQFRAYKRSLMGGMYNDLRWIAHERNQIMHFPDYTITEFSKFKSVTKRAIAYLQAKAPKRDLLALFVTVLKIVTVGAVIAFVLYFEWSFFRHYIDTFQESIVKDFHAKKWTDLAIRTAASFLLLGLALRLVMMVVDLLGSLSLLSYHMIKSVFRYWYWILFFFLIYLLWDKDVSYITTLYEKTLTIWSLL